MRRSIVFLVLSGIPLLASAAIYKWVDADGTVHFSDTPKEGAEEVHVAPPQTYSAPRVAPITPRPAEPEAPAAYARFDLLAPADDATLRENTGAITLSFAVDPPLKTGAGHRLVVLLDGAPVSEGKSATLTLENVDRGTHTLQGQIVDARGTVLMSSPSITVHLLRHSILAPPPAAPPAPKPAP